MVVLATVTFGFLTNSIHHAIPVDEQEGVLPEMIGLWFGVLLLVFAGIQRKRRLFCSWVKDNIDHLEDGAQRVYGGASLSLGSEVVSYQFCFSFFLYSVKVPSHYLTRGRRGVLTMLACSLFSFVFGWWAVPWGPVYTVQTIYRNLRGGIRETVADVIEQVRTET